MKFAARCGLPVLFFFLCSTPAPAASAAASSPRVALLFTDGPSFPQTKSCLEVLSQTNVRATFASVGEKIHAHPELTQAVHAAGHEIVNHSYTRPHLFGLSVHAIQHEVRSTTEKITEVTAKAPAWFWPPFFEWDERIAAAVTAADIDLFPLHGKHIVSADDWNPEVDAAAIRRRATTDIRDETIIVFHEWRRETIAALPGIVAELQRQGCQFLTLSELAAIPHSPRR